MGRYSDDITFMWSVSQPDKGLAQHRNFPLISSFGANHRLYHYQKTHQCLTALETVVEEHLVIMDSEASCRIL